jgi:hypothetical protein
MYTEDLPMFPEEYEHDEPLDLFHFLHYCFGFQVHIYLELDEDGLVHCTGVLNVN